MEIIINCIPLLSKLTGVGRYLYNILDNIRDIDKQNKYSFYYGIGIGMSEEIVGKELRVWDLLPWKKYHFIKYIAKFLKSGYEFLHLNNLLETYLGYKVNRILKYIIKFYIRLLLNTGKKEYDLYFEPNFIPLDNINAKKIVVTVHDFSFYLYPQWHPKDRVLFFSKHFFKNIYRSDIIITVSNYIKEQAQEIIKGYKGRIVCIYNGYDEKNFKVLDKNLLENYKKQKKLPKNFILFVGSIEPRKNLLNLLKAYELLPKSIREEIKLVLVGFYGWKNVEIMRILKRLVGDVYYMGYVDDEELPFLYNLALFSVYPSFYEGFGLPNVESMACGCPVITSDIPPIKEICEDAAVYIDPFDIESIKTSILKLIYDTNLRMKLRVKGLQQVKKFSWKISAEKHLEVFNMLF